jgi:hypothetical protein
MGPGFDAMEDPDGCYDTSSEDFYGLICPASLKPRLLPVESVLKKIHLRVLIGF